MKVDEFIKEECSKGYLIPIPIDIIEDIPNVEVCPVYLVKQYTVYETGTIIEKFRPCHNLSGCPRGFPNILVNKRHMKKKLPYI